jgi:hypothetical protein
VEQYVAQVHGLVSTFERQLGAAIQEAERILARRLALAEARLNATRLEEALQHARQRLGAAQQALNEAPAPCAMLGRPADGAELEAMQSYCTALQSALDRTQQDWSAAQQRMHTRRLGQRLAGTQVARGADAAQTLQTHAQQQREQARAALQRCLAAALAESQLALASLPPGTQALLQAAVSTGEDTPAQREQLQRWVAREVVQARQIAQAKALMLAPPDLVQARPQRAVRWQHLQRQLDEVIAGREAFTAQMAQEYAQIQADAQRDLNTRFAEADFVLSLRQQGFEVLQDEHARLVLVDLHNPGVWLEEVEPLELQGQQDGKASLLELRTDTPAQDTARDRVVIDNVCQRLQSAQPSSPQVKAQHQSVERKHEIRRATRPKQLRRLAAGA